MDKFLGQEYKDENARKEFLEANSDAIEEVSYTRRFSKDEMSAHRVLYCEASEKIEDLNEAKKEYLSQLKEDLKPLAKERKEILTKIKNKSEQVTEKCFKIVDHQNKETGYYNSLGELVYSRPIMPDEMQKTIFTINKATGTDD